MIESWLPRRAGRRRGGTVAEVVMARRWGVSLDERERMELERIVVDSDAQAALEFVRDVVHAKVRDSEKPGSCFHDVEKPVGGVARAVDRHKKLGSCD